MGTIAVPGVPTGMLVPGIYIHVDLGNAPPSAAGNVRRVLLVGTNSIDDAGNAEVGVLYRISRMASKGGTTPDMSSAQDLFGVDEKSIVAGSSASDAVNPEDKNLYWMCRAAFKANPFVSLYAIRVETTGDYANALDKMTGPAAAQQFNYVVVDTLDELDTIRDYVDGLADPIYGIRQQAIVGSTEEDFAVLTGAMGDTISPRLQVVWSRQPEIVINVDDDVLQASLDVKNGVKYTAPMLGAAMAATRARQEAADPGVNLCNEIVRGVPSVGPGRKLTITQLNRALQNGITPLVNYSGGSAILRSVTTAAKDKIFPVLDTTKVTVTDFVADDIQLKMAVAYRGFKLAPDTDTPLPSRTATPSAIKKSLVSWMRNHQAAGLIVLNDSLVERIQVEIDEDVDGRVNFEIPEDVIEIFAVGAGNLVQIG